MKKFFAIDVSDVVFIILFMNVKMPTFVGILTFMSRVNFMLSRVKHGKSFFYNLRASSSHMETDWTHILGWTEQKLFYTVIPERFF